MLTTSLASLVFELTISSDSAPSHARKCTEEGCESSHNTFLHGAERNFPEKSETPNGKFLRRTATDKAMFPENRGSVLSNLYAEDYLESSLTVEEGTRKVKNLVTSLSLGGFKLTKFVSNVPSIPAKLAPRSNAPTEVKEIPNTERSSHVLGLKWNHSTDTLVVSRGTNP